MELVLFGSGAMQFIVSLAANSHACWGVCADRGTAGISST